MRPPPVLALSLSLSFAALAACGGDDDGGDDGDDDGGTGGVEPLDLPDGCQPLLAGHHCTLPYPSDYFLVDDPSTPTGKRVQPTGAASLVAEGDVVADVHSAEVHDGSSAIPTIVAALPDDVSATGLAQLSDPEVSVSDDARTILLAPDGTRVPHYVDVDPNPTDPRRRAIVIHPLVGLEHGARYVVALRGVERADGQLAAPAEGFRRLRDGEVDGEPALEPLARFEDDVLAPLVEAGWQRDELQLAWDFTVGSREADTADMLRVRELTLAWLEANQPTVEVAEVIENPEGKEDVFRIVRGTVTGPLYLEENEPGARLSRDGDGGIVQNGTAAFEFVAVVPRAVADQAGPGRALAYGHGFFGGLAEVEGGSARTIANATGAVLFGIVWSGMSMQDVPALIGALTGEPSRTVNFADRVHQAIANWIVMGATIQGPLLAQEALQRTPGGEPLYQPDPLGFIGISQGHILGGTMTALNPFIDRICLQVGGAGFTHMMYRARPFESFLLVIRGILPDAIDQQLFAASLQRSFDRFDPGSYAHLLLAEPLVGDPRPLLLQVGLGDVSVPNLGSFLHARLIGVPLVEPSPVAVPGLEGTEGPAAAGLTLFDFGIDPDIYDQPQPAEEDNEVHEGVRLQPAALEQLATFLADGMVVHPCEGPCDLD